MTASADPQEVRRLRRDDHDRRRDQFRRRVAVDLSCGAALTNLELAARTLGRDCHVDLSDAGEVVATVTIGYR